MSRNAFFRFITVAASVVALQHCTSYNLDEKIRGTISGSPGTNTTGGGGGGNGGSAGPMVNRVYLFPTLTQVNGAFGGRTGADTLCLTARVSTTFAENQCINVRAFVSLSASDEIVDMGTNYGMPTGLPFNGPNNALLANSLSDLLDGTISVMLSSAGITLPAGWYSLSGVGTADGTLDGSANCTGGTASGSNGRYGQDNGTGTTWMSFTQAVCTTPRHLLCVCY